MRAGLTLALTLLLLGCGDPDPLDGDLVGTYALDAASFAQEALARRRDAGQEELAKVEVAERRIVEATWQQSAKREAERTAMALVLRSDGTFSARYRFGGENGSSAGTWARQGDEVVFQTTAEKGRRLTSAYASRARIQDGGLRVAGPRVPIPFTLHKR